MKTLIHTLRTAMMAGLVALSTGTALGQVPNTLIHNIPAPPTGAQFGAQLGYSVAVDGGYTVAGARYDDIAEENSGAVKVFDSATGALLFLLINPSPAVSEQFGQSVAISGTRVVVGANGDDTGASNAGSAYVYDLSSGTPTVPVATLSNPSPAALDFFGYSVAISGTRVVVGALFDDTGASDAGSAYVYDLSSGTPTVPVATLNNPSPVAGGRFGESLAISGTRVVVGASSDDTGATDAGSAYVYDLSSGTPTVPVATLNNPGPAIADGFGESVAISGTRVVVGAHYDNTLATDAGSAYVYDLSSGTPTVPLATLNNPSPGVNDLFGFSVAISGTQVVVGAYRDDTGAVDAGSAYVYDVSSGTPTVPVATLNNPSPAVNDYFGLQLAISGTRVVVGARFDNTVATDAGSAYLYDLSSGTPTVPVATLNNPTPATNDYFGASVAIDGTNVAIGAPNAYSEITSKGYAYVFAPDTTTLAPTLIAPADNTRTKGSISVSFTLPEAALPGSVKLQFGATSLTMATSQETAGAHSFTFDPANPGAAPEIASVTNGPVSDGSYAVTLIYQDALGNPAASDVNAPVDVDTTTLTPVLLAPAANSTLGSAIQVNYALPEAPTSGTVTLAFGANVLTLSALGETPGGGGVAFTFDPANPTATAHVASGGPIPDGTYTVTLSYQDVLGNPVATATSLNVTVDAVPNNPVSTLLASKNGAVPNAGTDARIQTGALWTMFGVPSVNGAGQTAFLASWKAPAATTPVVLKAQSGTGIFVGDALVVKKGDAVPGIANAVFSGFKDPLLGPDGSVAWIATLSNAPLTTGAVISTTNTAIFLDADGAGPNAAVLIAREGSVATGTTAGVWSAFTSVALGQHGLAFTGSLLNKTAGISPGPGNVTTLDDSGLWVYERAGSALALALREGGVLLGSTVKTINALVARPGTAGQGRGVESVNDEDLMVFRAKLADGRSTVGLVDMLGVVTPFYTSGDGAVDYGSGALWSSFGLPTQTAAAAMAFVGTVKSGTGTATSANNVAIFAENDGSYTPVRVVAKGDTAAGVSGGIFSALKDPVNAGNRSVAFLGAMKANAGLGISGANDAGIWHRSDSSALALIARENAQPAEAPAGAQWKAFTSLALPEGRGPLFVASMHSKIGATSPGPGGITTLNDIGLWATDSTGGLRLLLQEGDVIGSSTVKTFIVLSSVTGSPAQTRGFNAGGSVVVKVTDLTGAQHLVQIAVP